MSKTLSLIIPTYNERENIVPLIERVHQALFRYDYEIILVDDDSPDGTAELARELSKKYPLNVIVRRDKRGLSSAVVDGLEHARGDVIGVIDADLQHPPELIPDLLREIENGSDVSIASRYVEGGGSPGWSLARRIVSKGAAGLAHILLPSTRDVKDPLAGFFLFRRDGVADVDLQPTGYKILLEILVTGRLNRVAEVPYSFGVRKMGRSKLSARQQIDYLRHIYSLMRRTGELWRFAKFCLVGASGVLVNMGLLWLLTEVAGLFYLLSACISGETSIVSNFLLNDNITFRDRRLPTAKATLHRLGKYNLVSLVAVAINLGVLALLTEVFGVYYLISNLCGIAIATLWNFVANTSWTWR